MNNKILRRGMPFSPEVASLVGHMPLVDEYREALLRLQGVWDSLSMLGQMSGTVPDIDGTRRSFQALTETLLDSLARRLLANVLQQMRGQAQVAIDVLVRNLFERTADVGFLACDRSLTRFVDPGCASPPSRQAVEARFHDYVAKYSVYDDVMLLDPQGRVLARLDGSRGETTAREAWVGEALRAPRHVEYFGPSSLHGGDAALLYAHAVRGPAGVAAVLCLSFRFEDEMRGIFTQLRAPGEAAVLTLVDAGDRVVASADPLQVPLGAVLQAQPAPGGHERLRLAGRDYLCVSATATGYEGYHGPGWRARVLVTTQLAFETLDDDALQPADQGPGALGGALDTEELFDEELRNIPRQAAHIQRDLARVLWNGHLRPPGQGSTAGFAATLLREVGRTGEQIRQLFGQATGNLHRSALGAVFDLARSRARLAVDLMDRNLYERANDCRWWALDAELRALLAQPHGQRDASRAGAVLQAINRLYTVYALLVLFDEQGEVLAVSQPHARDWIGRRLEADWLEPALALRDAQAFTMSAHAPSALYGGQATYVYAAAVLDEPLGSRARGGVALVFDGTPQFEAMLRDALPLAADGRPVPGSSALLVTREGRVVASTDARWPVGSQAPVAPQGLARGQSITTVVDVDGVAHAAALSMAGGYREYQGMAQRPAEDVAALVLMRLGRRLAVADTTLPGFQPPAAPLQAANEDVLEIASFAAGQQWLGLPASCVQAALEHPRITALPGLPRHVLGLLPSEGRMILVLDLATLRGGPAAPADGPVIVVDAPGGGRFALRVQALGPVFAAPSRALEPLGLAFEAETERLVRSDGPMLTLLDAQRLYGLCGRAA